MNKVDQMWYLLHICYDFDMVVNPFFRAVQPTNYQTNQENLQLLLDYKLPPMMSIVQPISLPPWFAAIYLSWSFRFLP